MSPTPEHVNSILLDGMSLMTVREDGTRIVVSGPIDGWGSPGSTIAPTPRSRQHGSWAGEAWLTDQLVTLMGTISAPTYRQAVEAFDELVSACALEGVPLTVNEDGLVRTMTVRRQGPPYKTRISETSLRWSLSMLATDPRKTATDLTGATGLPSSTGGLTVPFTVPFSIDAVTVSGQVSLRNPGNIAGRVVLRIDGPVTGPVVTHVSSGRSLVFAASLTIPEGNFVLVDMEARSVLENGTASRNGWVTRRGWSAFEPGDNTWAFSAPTHDAGTLTVTATPSWM